MKRIQRNEAVRALRKTIGLNQAEFAEMIGASKDAVVSWEKQDCGVARHARCPAQSRG